MGDAKRRKKIDPSYGQESEWHSLREKGRREKQQREKQNKLREDFVFMLEDLSRDSRKWQKQTTFDAYVFADRCMTRLKQEDSGKPFIFVGCEELENLLNELSPKELELLATKHKLSKNEFLEYVYT